MSDAPWHGVRPGITIRTNAASLDPREWDAICERQPFATHRWLCLLEAIRLNYRPIYFELREDSELVAGAVCWFQSDFHVTKNLGSVVAQTAIDLVTRRRPVLMCSLAGLMQPALLLPRADQAPAHLTQLIESMRGVARSERALCVGFNDVPAAQVAYLAAAGVECTRELPPEAIVSIWHRDLEQFLSELPKKSRTKVRRYRRRAFESGIHVEQGPLGQVGTDETESLVRQVEHRHGNDYPYVAGFADIAAATLAAEEHRAIRLVLDQTLVACATVVRSGPAAIAKWVGLDYSRSADSYAYHLLVSECVGAAIELGASELFLGPTTYPIKLQVGAQLHDRYVAIAGRRAMSSALLNRTGLGVEVP